MKKNCNGFILLEVMLALVILTSGVLLLTRVLQSSLELLRQSEEYYAGTLAIESRVWELEKTGRWGMPLESDPVLGTLAWQHDAQDVTLRWGQGKHANTLTLTTPR